MLRGKKIQTETVRALSPYLGHDESQPLQNFTRAVLYRSTGYGSHSAITRRRVALLHTLPNITTSASFRGGREGSLLERDACPASLVAVLSLFPRRFEPGGGRWVARPVGAGTFHRTAAPPLERRWRESAQFQTS